MTSRRIVKEGDPITLSWDTNNGNETACTLTGGNVNGVGALGNGTLTNETGEETIPIAGRTTFVITCGGLSDALTIDMIPSAWEW